MSEIIVHVSSPYTIPGTALHRALLLPLYRVWPRAWTVTSIVVIIVASITMERVLGLILTSYIIVYAITAFVALLVIRCKERR